MSARRGPVVVAFLSLVALSSCGGNEVVTQTGSTASLAGGIRVEGTWAARISAPHAAAFYFVATNDGSTDDRLIGATSPDAGSVALFEAGAGGSTTLVPVDAIDVPAGGSVNVEPGGREVILLALKSPPRVGSSLSIILEFEHAGRIEAEGEVRPFVDPVELPSS